MRIDPPEPFSRKVFFTDVEPGDVFLCPHGKYYLKIKGAFRTAVCLLNGETSEFESHEVVEVVDCFLKIERR